MSRRATLGGVARRAASIGFSVVVVATVALAQTTAFTFQGRLSDGGLPAHGDYDMQFSLFDEQNDGTQIGPTLTSTSVEVILGNFTARLDFGDGPFSGEDRYLEIAVSPAGEGTFTTLLPRMAIDSAPYAVRSLNATSADVATDSLALGGVAADQYVLTDDPRMSDARLPLPGSASYIQNQAAIPQASSSFRISGTGRANILSADTQFNIGDGPALSFGTSIENLHVGGASPASTGNGLTYIGRFAGFANTSGGDNTFVGSQAGRGNTIGSGGSFFGKAAGLRPFTGDHNTFIGFLSDFANVPSPTGSNNTLLGAFTVVGSGVSHATAIGAGATVSASNTVVLGRSADSVQIPGTFGVGTTAAPNGRMEVVGHWTGEEGALRITGDRPTIRLSGGAPTNDSSWILHLGSIGPGHLEFYRRTGPATWSMALGLTQNLTVKLSTLAPTSGGTALCRNPTTLEIQPCSASSLRYKTGVEDYSGGLRLVERMRPISFAWKSDGRRDLGFAAEEMAEIEPLLTYTNAQGEIDGLNYPQITAVLVNAIKEQQQRLEAQSREIEALRDWMCQSHPQADLCREPRAAQ
jgi:hypothetical protein